MGLMAAILVITGLMSTFLLQPRAVLDELARRNPEVLYFVETDERIVALTIDDGPHPITTQSILSVLGRHSAKATFFLLGDRLKGNDQMLHRIRADGHEVGNHLKSDTPSILLDAKSFERQLMEVDRMLFDSPPPVRWFRPGSGWFDSEMLAQLRANNYRCCLGSIYPHDTLMKSESLISKFILSRVFPGGIIVLHGGSIDRLRTARVLDKVLPELQKRGYEIVTVSELLRRSELPNYRYGFSPPAE